jgi:hypothetical protein
LSGGAKSNEAHERQADKVRFVDPGVLEVIGIVADLLGLTEHIQALAPLDRLRMTRRHQRIEKLLRQFGKALDDGRAALRIVASAVERNVTQAGAVDSDTIGFPLPGAELAVYRRGFDQILVALRKMTTAALELEAATAGMPEEVQRYHRISAAGRLVREKLAEAVQGPPTLLPALLQETERYLAKSSELVAEAQRWREL